jgi:hypothetical protein
VGRGTWVTSDFEDAADSGWARVVNTRSDSLSGPVNRALECFAVEAGAPYTAAAWILIPEGQATVMVRWYASGTCSQVAFLSFGRTFEIRDPGSWRRTEEPLTVPPGALGARVGSGVFKTEATGSLAVHFDELQFAPEPSAGGSGLATLVGLVALGIARWPGVARRERAQRGRSGRYARGPHLSRGARDARSDRDGGARDL